MFGQTIESREVVRQTQVRVEVPGEVQRSAVEVNKVGAELHTEIERMAAHFFPQAVRVFDITSVSAVQIGRDAPILAS